MRIDKMRVTCQAKECGHVQDVDVVVDCPLEVTAASMATARCSKCGSGKLGLGGAFDDAPPLSAPVAARASWWKTRGYVGVSSGTIYHALTGGIAKYSNFDIPYDPDDFSRCRMLLDLIPEWRGELGKVAEKFPKWKPFADNWDKLDAMYDEGMRTNWKTSEMYKFMVGLRETRP